MSYFGSADISGGVSFGNDYYDSIRTDGELTDMSVYGGGAKLDPYLPIENEPMGRDYAPNNFNSSDPSVKSNYKYNPLSTYNLDTDAIYSNHMRGSTPSLSDIDDVTRNPNRNSFNVEKDFIKDNLEYGSTERMKNRPGHNGNGNGNGKEKMCGCAFCKLTGDGSGTGNVNMFLLFIIIVLVIFAFMQMKQNKELLYMLRSTVKHRPLTAANL
jgi:hypothetical protein